MDHDKDRILGEMNRSALGDGVDPARARDQQRRVHDEMNELGDLELQMPNDAWRRISNSQQNLRTGINLRLHDKTLTSS